MWFVLLGLPVASSSLISVNWSVPPVATTEGVPTYLNQVNPSMDRESPIHDAVFRNMCSLGTHLVRYLHWGASQAPFPELTEGSFNFTLMDQYIVDFMQCPNAQDSVINFDMLGGPSWLHVNGDLTKPLRDPSGNEYGEWISRMVSWYTKGGFTDHRTGKIYKSTHNFNWTNYEVLNEPDLEGYMSKFVDQTGDLLPPFAAYTRLYDGIALVLRRDHPELKLHALSLAHISTTDDWFSYFYDKANHLAEAPMPSYVTYHNYVHPGRPLGNKPGDWPINQHGVAKVLPVEQWPIHFFKQAASFVVAAARTNSIIREGSFGGDKVKVSVNEVGVIGGDLCPTSTLFNSSKLFWNLKAALWAYYYGELVRLGASSVASSQIAGYPANTWTIRGAGVKPNCPCVSMLDWHDGSGTAVFWAVKMFGDVLGAGNKSVFSTTTVSKNTTVSPYWPLPSVVYSIGFALHTRNTRVLLLANTNSSEVTVNVSGVVGGKMHVVDTKAGHSSVPYATKVLVNNEVRLGPLAVALVEFSRGEHDKNMETYFATALV